MILSRYKRRDRVQTLAIRVVQGTDGTQMGCDICT